MTEEIASIDDRTFQGLVDEAKRLIPQLCPEWTNHGPADPGIALIEVFAWMTEQLIQRLNTIPQRVHEAFVRLVGIEPFPATAASVEVLAMTSNADFEPPLFVAKGTVFSTSVRESGEAVQFTSDADVRLWRPWLTSLGTMTAAGQFVVSDATPPDELDCFPANEPGAALVLGLSRSCADHVLRIDVELSSGGIGIDPADPPLVWEAWGRDQWGWVPVHVLSDTTRGLCRSGAVDVVIPSDHEALQLGAHTASWLRVRLLAARPGQVTYAGAPRISSIVVSTVGGVVRASHSSTRTGELLGVSDGNPGQRFRTSQSPLLPRSADERVLVDAAWGATSEWREVDDFSNSGPMDRHYTIESATGTVRFGPAVTLADGRRVQHGAIVPAGAQLRISAYRIGGGSIGNVGPGTVTVLGASVPYVERVLNVRAAIGGSDAEDIDNWRARSRLWLQTGGRAVTAADFERIALWAHSGIARVLCLDPSGGGIRLLIVPHVWTDPAAITLDDFAPSPDILAAVAGVIDERRLIGTSVEITTPSFAGVSVVARVRPQPYHLDAAVRRRCLDAVAGFMHPTTGGATGAGWPFGRDVDELAVGSILNGVDGVEEVAEVLLFDTDLRTGERSGVGRRRLHMPADSLPLLVRPQIVVDRGQ